VILISDATASGIGGHYKTALERVRDYYGIVTNIQENDRHFGTDYKWQSKVSY
jgi:hypothetical protein